MGDNNFFEEQKVHSKVKANIVAEYFPKYCKILLKTHRGNLRYLDLFAGPGIYGDGNWSTPMLIGDACAKDSVLKDRVQLLFNDKEHGETLKINFEKQFPQGTFKLTPKFATKTVGEDKKIDDYLNKVIPKGGKFTPTLLFFDPFGYKGINSQTLSNFLNNFGNEVFLFFNIKRIHPALENDKFEDLMTDIFPTTIGNIKEDRKHTYTVDQRLSLIIQNLAKEFESRVDGTVYHCAFKFQEDDRATTSHYIIHFTKHQKGYELVKQIYHEFDNIGAALEADGTYTFDSKRLWDSSAPSLDFGDPNASALGRALTRTYRGRTIDARSLFDEHQKGTKYSTRHYLNALRALVENKQLTAKYNDDKEHRVPVLLNSNCILEFANV